MKKLAILVAIVMAMSAMCISAIAINLDSIQLQPQIWAQNTVDWSDWTELKLADGSAHTLSLGETKTFVFSGDAWAALDSTAFQYGIQILDLSHTEAGDESTIKYEISDIVFEAEGYDTYTAPLAGVYEASLKSYVPDWGGLADNSHVPGSYDLSGVAGGSDGASLMAYWDALTSVTMTITFLEYNGETAGAPADEAPVEDVPVVEEPAVEDTITEVPAEDTTEAPAETGLALAVVPMIVAAAALVVSKKR